MFRGALCLVLALMIAPPSLAQMSEPDARRSAERFADQVVRVITRRVDGSRGEAGFGIVVGERENSLFVATPHHVAFGRSNQPPAISDQPSVVFRSDRWTEVQGRRLPVASPQERDDLAVIEVPKQPGICTPQIPRIEGSSLQLGSWAWNIGFGVEWDLAYRAGGVGPVDAVTRLRRIGQLQTPPGASGGAVVNQDGLIGMVLIDAGHYSLALPVERILELFAAWSLPTNLIARPRPQQAPARTYLVFFEYGRDNLSQRALQIVAEAAQVARLAPNVSSVAAEGHTDTAEARDFPQSLSLDRARAVEQALQRLCVPPGQMRTSGAGDRQLLVPTPMNVREPQNRRVEIVLR